MYEIGKKLRKNPSEWNLELKSFTNQNNKYWIWQIFLLNRLWVSNPPLFILQIIASSSSYLKQLLHLLHDLLLSMKNITTHKQKAEENMKIKTFE